jgi:hypothetical protein
MTDQMKETLSREGKRLASRKFIAWVMFSGLYAITTGVLLRTCSMATWQSYQAIENGKAVVEALGALNILKDAWMYMSGAYVIITLLYMGSNLAEKFMGAKFGNTISTQ